MGGTEAEPKHMVAVYLLGSGAGLMGQPRGHGEAALRGALDQGDPSPPLPTALLSWAGQKPGALWGRVGSRPAPPPPPARRGAVAPALSARHLEMPAPPPLPAAEGLGLPLTVLGAPGGPCKVRPPWQGGRTPGQARPLAQPGQAAAPPTQWPPQPPSPPQSVISPPSEQLVLPGKLPNESTMRGLWRRNGCGAGFSPSARPTGHRGHLWGSRAPCSPPPPTGSYPQHPEG